MVDCRFLLYMIDDGGWHSLEEVAKEIGWSRDRLLKCVRSLAEARFIHYDEDRGEVRVQNWLLNFPRSVWQEPGKRATGSVVMEPESTAKLGEVEVQNLLGLNVEVTFLIVDGKLKQISMQRFEGEDKPEETKALKLQKEPCKTSPQA